LATLYDAMWQFQLTSHCLVHLGIPSSEILLLIRLVRTPYTLPTSWPTGTSIESLALSNSREVAREVDRDRMGSEVSELVCALFCNRSRHNLATTVSTSRSLRLLARKTNETHHRPLSTAVGADVLFAARRLMHRNNVRLQIEPAMWRAPLS
jgi:hypothetical protein